MDGPASVSKSTFLDAERAMSLGIELPGDVMDATEIANLPNS